MKSLNIICTLFLMTLTSIGIFAQTSGEITYQETMKLEFKMDDMPAGVDLSGMMPSDRKVTKILSFNKDVSLYVDGKEVKEDTEMSSDDGSIKIVMKQSDIDEALYVDQKNKVSVERRGFMEKPFIIGNEVEKYKWKITTEKVKYLDYECIKATTINSEDKEVVAWFAPSIPVTAGPNGYGQLPGAILMLSEDGEKLQIKATNVELKAMDEIKEPTDGKKVTMAEYEKIVEEKMKEMEKEFGGKGHRIMIRG